MTAYPARLTRRRAVRRGRILLELRVPVWTLSLRDDPEKDDLYFSFLWITQHRGHAHRQPHRAGRGTGAGIHVPPQP
jgi:hypothetical protein